MTGKRKSKTGYLQLNSLIRCSKKCIYTKQSLMPLGEQDFEPIKGPFPVGLFC